MMIMQNDGNLVSYCTIPKGKTAKWSMVIGANGPKRMSE